MRRGMPTGRATFRTSCRCLIMIFAWSPRSSGRPLEESADAADEPPAGSETEACYQLAHDYLIRPIRQWLERHLRASREGRAHLRLEAVTSAWIDHPGAHRLPSLLEYLGIVLYTRRSDWNAQERRVMRAASRHLLARLCVLGLLVVAVVIGSNRLANWIEQRDLLNTALAAEDRQLPALISRLEPYRDRVTPELEAKERGAPPGDRARDVAGMLLYRIKPTETRGQYLRTLLLEAQNPDRVEVVRDCLATHPEHAGIAELHQELVNGDSPPGNRLRAACALAALKSDCLDEPDAVISGITSALLEERSRLIPGWLKLLRSAQAKLLGPLGKICADPEIHALTRATAAEAAGEILRREGDMVGLAAMAVSSLPDASEILLRELVGRGTAAPAVEFFQNVLTNRVESQPDEPSKNRLAARLCQAAIGLEVLGVPGTVSALLKNQSDPRVFAFLIQRQAAFSMARPRQIERLTSADAGPLERQATLLIWTETPAGNVTSVRSELLRTARAIFLGDPDPGVHSAAELLLHRLGGDSLVTAIEQELRQHPQPEDKKHWFVGPAGLTFAVINGPVDLRHGFAGPGGRASPDRGAASLPEDRPQLCDLDERGLHRPVPRVRSHQGAGQPLHSRSSLPGERARLVRCGALLQLAQ